MAIATWVSAIVMSYVDAMMILVYVYHLSWSHIHLHKRRGLLAIATWPFGKSEVGIKPWP